MNASMLLWNRLKKDHLVALASPESAEQCLALYETLNPLQVVMEVALRTPAALDGIRAVVEKHPDALLLAGTVLEAPQAEQALNAGAAGIVSPDYIPGVVEVCCKRDALCIPGGTGDAGKQLAQKAALYNCSLEELRIHHPYQWIYKLFPAMAGAPALLEAARAWRAVYPGLMLVYTGGVKREHIPMIFAHDPEAVICASALAKEADDPAAVRRAGMRWRATLREALRKVNAGEPLEDSMEADMADTVEKTFQPMEKQAPDEETPPIVVTAPAPAGNAVEGAGGERGDAVVTFGEILLRLSTPQGTRFGQAGAFEACFGGAEANVAAALADFGRDVRYVTALPDHDLGRAARDALRARGVDTRFVHFAADERMGLYYLEPGASQRPSRVIYDRAASAFTRLRPGSIDWEAVFQDARWFHVTGITPALGEGAAQLTMEALKAARRAECTVSIDLNYRAKLWSKEKAQEILVPMMLYVNVVMGNEEDAAQVFDLKAGAESVASGEIDLSAFEAVTREMVKSMDFDLAALTLRESRTASDNLWSACCFDGKQFHHSKKYPVHVVDRVGAGDAFAAGLIHALLEGKETADALEFAAAAACLKHSIRGDFNRVNADEVEALVRGAGQGRIER